MINFASLFFFEIILQIASSKRYRKKESENTVTDQDAERQIVDAKDRASALEILMDAYGDRIKRLVYSYVKDWVIAGEITQEAFVAAYVNMDAFGRRSSYKTWISTIAVNKCKDYLKSWNYKHTLLNEKVFFFMKDSKRTPEEQFLQTSESAGLLEAVLELPLKYREGFLLYYYQDLSIDEISDTLGISPATVKTRLYRGKNKLKSAYQSDVRGEDHG